MAVFTPITHSELSTWLQQYSVGELTRMQGILHGIENTNYFVSTGDGEFVLTIFEVLKASELPFYLHFMAHLASHGVSCPRPIANLKNEYLGEIHGKPASLVTRLGGQATTAPSVAQCARVGTTLAHMHLAGQTFPPSMENPRGPAWWRFAAEKLKSFLGDDERQLLESELAFQLSARPKDLPRGVVHADLFRDNVLFEGESLGGVIDFYFAGADDWMFDLAVTVNDWCPGAASTFDRERLSTLLCAYERARPTTAAEQKAWPIMLRAAALRFWLSRLYDRHLPRKGEMVMPHDPAHFRELLEAHRREEPAWPIG
jgi:homoserine kinase type II